MVAHAGTLSVFGRHGRRSDRRAAVLAVRAQRIISIQRDDAASRSTGAVSIVVFTVVDSVLRYFGSRLTVTRDDGGGNVRRNNIRQRRHFDSLAEKTVCVGYSGTETDGRTGGGLSESERVRVNE